MTYTFKLSRRIARLRAPALATLMFVLAGCDSTQPLDPGTGITPDVSTHAVPADPQSASASFAGGIPIGMTAQPVTAFGGRFNGSKLTLGPGQLLEQLSAVRSRGGRIVVMLAGNPRHYVDGNGHFSLTKWKARVDLFKGIDFGSYVSDGTIIAHYLLDEPNDPANWNGQQVSPSTLEQMAQYSKQLWPAMPTIVRVEPSYLGGSHKYLDAAWAQYLARRGDVNDYIKRNVADAQQRGLALVVGLNVVHGGTPTKTRMTASQVEAWGSALLSSSYPCAFIMWQHDSDYLSSAGLGSAMDALRRLAQNRSSRTCRGATAAGGETPPAPSPSPDPAPAPSPSAGIPFGPSGLPVARMASYSGAIRGATPSTAISTASAARKAGTRLVLRLTGGDVTNGNGTFSLTKWKAALDRYAGVDLSSYVKDGVLVGHLLIQNPQNAGAWGGQPVSYVTLEEMARYSRLRWPALPTIVQAPPSWLAANPAPWQYLDASSVTYSGAAGDAATWVNSQANWAAGARLGLLVGMNVLNGGTSASGLPGTIRGKYAMSASQLRTWGLVLAGQSRTCGLILSRYDETYFGRSDVREAVAEVAQKAGARDPTSCRVRF
ncbi:MAG: hypothetical protein H0X69_10885 [Gemmatimonadales bacterium]|nr:hypothetical protein [Gemmatimonadales bacterium]